MEDLSMTEMTARALLLSYLERKHQRNPEKNMEELFSDANNAGRFQWFIPFLPSTAKNSILVSGCAIGSELLTAKRYGFLKITGTETDADLADIARLRLQTKEHIQIDLYDGKTLPYPDHHFSMICSAHIIEHTPAPEQYFREHVRVLRPGGYFYLEFPNRYHHTELHTGLPSVEWLPLRLRQWALTLLSSSFMPVAPQIKQYYNLILQTLQPVSIHQIRQYVRLSDAPASSIIAIQIPAPGFVQLLIRKA